MNKNVEGLKLGQPQKGRTHGLLACRIGILTFSAVLSLHVLAAPARAEGRDGELASGSEIGFAEYSQENDFIKAGRDKVLLRWGGEFFGARIPLEDRLSGGILSRGRPTRLADLVSNRRHPNQALVAAAQTFGSRDIAAWICSPSAALLVFAPSQNRPSTSNKLEFLKLSGDELIGGQTGAAVRLRSCAVDDDGQLFVAFENSGGGELQVALPVADRPSLRRAAAGFAESRLGLGTSSAVLVFRVRLKQQTRVDVGANDSVHDTADASKYWAVVMSSPVELGKPVFDLKLYDDSLGLVKSLRVLTPLNSLDSSALANLRIVARDNQIVAVAEGTVALSNIALNAESTVLVDSVRLPIAPCSETQVCGLSLGQDGSWLVVGYWGSYFGFGEKFRRAVLRSFSDEAGTVTVAHTRIPGEVAVFGSDDSSFEKILGAGFNARSVAAFTAPVALQSRSWSQQKASVAWLRPGVSARGDEQILFDLSPLRSSVVLTRGKFDPKRHLAFETPQGIRLSDDPQPLEYSGLAPDGSWFREFLHYQAAQDKLDGTGIKLHPITVTVLDSGADLAHPDFHPAPDSFHGAATPAVTSEYDIGYDFVDEDDEPQDQFGHGAHVSGLAKPAMPMFGHIGLVIARVLDATGKSNSVDIGRGFIYAAKRGSDIINASWGGGARTQFMQDAIEFAQAKGALIVNSAGNDRLNIDKDPPVPGNFADVLSIGALSRNGRRAAFSNFGKEGVFGFVPGDEIESLALGGGTTLKSGTSMASPLFVSSAAVVAGLIKALDPEKSPSQWQSDLQRAFCPSEGVDPLSEPLRAKSRCGSLDLQGAVEAILAKSR
jgi:hypothetical protein